MAESSRRVVKIGGRAFSVELSALGDGRYRARVDGSEEGLLLELLDDSASAVISVDGQLIEIGGTDTEPSVRGERRELTVEGARAQVERRNPGTRGGPGSVPAPMPGRIVKLLVAPGDVVVQGAGLVVMEAMKMENEILAPRAGKVARVLVSAGSAVERGALLVELE